MDFSLCLFTSTDQDRPEVRPPTPQPPARTYTQNLRPIKTFGICRTSKVLGDLEISNLPQRYMNSPCFKDRWTSSPLNVRLGSIHRLTCCQSWKAQWQRPAGHTLGSYSPWWRHLLPHGQTASQCSQLQRRRNRKHILNQNNIICLYVHWISRELFLRSTSHLAGVLLGTQACAMSNLVQLGHVTRLRLINLE